MEHEVSLDASLSPRVVASLRKVSILIHTRGRPDFILRALDYYDQRLGALKIPIIVADGSEEDQWSVIQSDIYRRQYVGNITLVHRPHDYRFDARILDGLSHVSTPYIILAADDDLYMFDWLEAGVELLDTDATFGVVYGHVLLFEIPGRIYAARGSVGRYYPARMDNPPHRWLEGHAAAERLTELGNPDSDIATVGWYALQRTDLLKQILRESYDRLLELYGVEKLLVLKQAALCRTRMLNEVYLARQICPQGRPPHRHKEKEITTVVSIISELLEKEAGLGREEALALAHGAFKGEVATLERNQSRQTLRALMARVPALRSLRELTRKHAARGQSICQRDPRFPTLPQIDAYASIVDIVSKTVDPNMYGTAQ